MQTSVEFTFLSSILGPDFPLALERQRDLGLAFLDLKDGLWGKTIEQLDEAEATRAAALISDFGLAVHCFSTSIGHTDLVPETNESAFRKRHDSSVEKAIRSAAIMRPRVIRLLSPRLSPLGVEPTMARLLREFPWVIGVYRDWVDRIHAAGFGVLIENEARGCVLGSVSDVQTFFVELNRPAARYTWDVQNLWQSGTFPSLEVYRQFQPRMGALHLKGGRGDLHDVHFAAPLEEASWPVLEIMRAVLNDGVAPFIRLNPSHGEKPPGWDVYEVACRDLAFLRRNLLIAD